MGASGPRLQAVEIGADVIAGQVQHLAAEPPVLLDLRLGFRRPRGPACRARCRLRDPAYGGLEGRVLELEMNAQARTQVRVAVGDHVDALDGRDRLDVLQALERLDGHADDDVGIGPRRILGGVTGAMAPVSVCIPAPAMPRWPIGGYFACATIARASSTLSTSETWMPMIPWSRIAGIRCVKDLWIRTIAETSVA